MHQIVVRNLNFDRFSLDLARGTLRSADGEISLRPKSFDVLLFLVNNPQRIVSKQELNDAVWSNMAVTDGSLVQCIRELREKLGDSEHRLVKTVHRRGYLLDAIVSVADQVDPPPEQPIQVDPANAFVPPDETPIRSPQYGSRVLVALGLAILFLVACGGVFWRGSSEFLLMSRTAKRADVSGEATRVFKDCENCPEMVALPAGKFLMGSPEDQAGRVQNEGLPRRVVISRPIAIGRFEISVDEYASFLKETGTQEGQLCQLISSFDEPDNIRSTAVASFHNQPGYEITGSHPAGCLNWHDAQAYAAWLKRRTGKPYRLPTEAEWEYAARAGTTSNFSFGDEGSQLCEYARFADLNSPFAWRTNCRSPSAATGPFKVGQLKPNPWGLYDVHGNVWEWVEDCWTADPSKIPTDGSAFSNTGTCEMGVVRGGAWVTRPQRTRSAFRLGLPINRRLQPVGFRIALTLE
jgi:formylglycine-generating enzyme required for sulfatase activity